MGRDSAVTAEAGTTPTSRWTVGVEEEYHLVDAETYQLRDAPDVVAAAQARLGECAQSEISTTQLEIATPVLETLSDVRAAVSAARRGADEGAREHGCRILAAASHPTASWREQRLTPKPRYLELLERWGVLALQQGITGCHVHVGVPDADTAIAVMDRSRPWLPVLLALTGSSPFWEGNDTGYASYRTQWFARWPITGAPEPLGDRASFDRLIRQLVETGVIVDASHLYWDVRPSQRFPTVEFRVADVCPEIDDVVLHAGLVRSLVRTLAQPAEAQPQLPELRPELLRAARWRAARHGLAGALLDPVDQVLRPAADVVGRLLDALRPDLESAGEWSEVAHLAERALARGSSAARQRAVLARDGDLTAVTAALVAETMSGTASGAGS